MNKYIYSQFRVPVLNSAIHSQCQQISRFQYLLMIEKSLLTEKLCTKVIVHRSIPGIFVKNVLCLHV